MINLNSYSDSKKVNDNSNIPVSKVKVTKIPANFVDLTGRVFGDYIVVGQNGRDNSGHVLWKCVCRNCGDTFSTTSYELLHNRKNVVCSNCLTVFDIEKDDLIEDNKDEINNCDGNCTNCLHNLTNEEYKKYTEDIDAEDTEDTEDTEYEENEEDNADAYTFKATTKRLKLTDILTVDTDGDKIRMVGDINNVKYFYDNKDLMEMPVYYNIVHCLPADLSVYGKLTEDICSKYELINKIKIWYDEIEDPLPGDCVHTDNVFTLIVNEACHVLPTYDNLCECLYELALSCRDNGIHYLAMPKICCGHNGLKWDEVERFIKLIFTETYLDADEYIEIHFCSLNPWNK